MCVFLWLWIYSTSLFFITTIFSLYNRTAAHSSKQKSEKTDVSLYCRETLLFSAAAYHLFKINMALATAVDGVQIKKYYFKKRERERVLLFERRKGEKERKKKKKLDICLERCLCFFPFIWRETRGINFRENDQGVVKYIVYTHTYERQQLMTDDNIFTHLYSSSISFLSKKEKNLMLSEYTTRISSSIQLCDADGNDETQ